MAENDDILTASDIAKMSGLSKQRVIQLIRDEREIPNGRKYRSAFGVQYWGVPRTDAISWIHSHKKKAN